MKASIRLTPSGDKIDRLAVDLEGLTAAQRMVLVDEYRRGDATFLLVGIETGPDVTRIELARILS